jgi:hypothetical protein
MRLRYMKLSFTSLSYLSILLVLFACGGGGGGGTPPQSPAPVPSPSPSPGPINSVHYLLSGGDNLLAIDPNDTSSIVRVSDEPINFLTTITVGKYNSSTKMLENFYFGGLLYEQGGKVYFVSTDGANVKQVSNETQADTTCGQPEALQDISDINNNRFVYQLSGADGNCNTIDDVYRMIKLSMGHLTHRFQQRKYSHRY